LCVRAYAIGCAAFRSGVADGGACVCASGRVL